MAAQAGLSAAAGGALLYPSGDEAGLAAALGRLLDEPELWPGLAASVPADPVPTIDASVDALVAVYEEARAAGAPEGAGSAEDQRMIDLVRARALELWDESLSRRTPVELGLEPPPESPGSPGGDAP